VFIESRKQKTLCRAEPMVLRRKLRRRNRRAVISLRHQCERKVAADSVGRRHQGANNSLAAMLGAKPKSPDRRLQKRGFPVVTRRCTRAGTHALQPWLPLPEEAARHSNGDEIGLGGELAVQTALHAFLTAPQAT